MNDKQEKLIVKMIETALAPLTQVEKINIIERLGKRLRRKNSAESEEEVAQFAKKMTGKRIIDY